MKEQELPVKAITWPKEKIVNIGPEVDFVYIVRKDTKFAMDPVSHCVSQEYYLDETRVQQVMYEEYDTFFSTLADSFQDAFRAKGNFNLHIFDPDEIDSLIREKSEGMPIVSLDPLMEKGVFPHKVSRGYFLSGKKDFGQVSRPGSSLLEDQSQGIAQVLGGNQVVVAEDDIFSGGSVVASLEGLIDSGIQIQKVVPGIQVGNPKKVSEMGITIDPVIAYKATDNADIFDKVDLGDPRDYLMGASGLVVKLPSGELGRAPYIIPFVSASARAGVPEEKEEVFTNQVLQANLAFFQSVERKIGKSLLLRHMDKSFIKMMYEVYGFDSNTPMQQVAKWAIESKDTVWEHTQAMGEFQSKLEHLSLPPRLVFVDVNDTLVSDDSESMNIASHEATALQDAISTANEKGVTVGLCSDSPLEQLQVFAEQLGFDGPILAENGNIISYKGEVVVVRTVEDIDGIKSEIRDSAKTHGYLQTDDIIHTQFGGEPVDYDNPLWGFGANRKTSLAVFGQESFIKQLGKLFNSELESLNIDCSPEHNFFAIHPGSDFRKSKGETLALLAAYGYSVGMIGNAISDWVDPNTGVSCSFVANARITQEVRSKSFVSEKPLVEGVVDILRRIK